MLYVFRAPRVFYVWNFCALFASQTFRFYCWFSVFLNHVQMFILQICIGLYFGEASLCCYYFCLSGILSFQSWPFLHTFRSLFKLVITPTTTVYANITYILQSFWIRNDFINRRFQSLRFTSIYKMVGKQIVRSNWYLISSNGLDCDNDWMASNLWKEEMIFKYHALTLMVLWAKLNSMSFLYLDMWAK